MDTRIHTFNTDLEVEYTYSPEERQTYNDPGCAATVRLEQVILFGVDFSSGSLPAPLCNLIEDKILEDLAGEDMNDDWPDDEPEDEE